MTLRTSVCRPLGHRYNFNFILCVIVHTVFCFCVLLCENGFDDEVNNLVRRWAPMVWLAPGERYNPSSVEDFLNRVNPTEPALNLIKPPGAYPTGPESLNWFLVPDQPTDELLADNSSYLYGTSPTSSTEGVPVYAVVKRCNTGTLSNTIDPPPGESKYQPFHVTFWFFYPYNYGKDLCSLKLSFGTLPIPKIFNTCLGKHRTFGNHVSDWEHVSLSFDGHTSHPGRMYVSTHDAGAYYKYDSTKTSVSKKAFLKQGRPILFAAIGSHGLWTAPGRHRFVRIPRLTDVCGFGTPWETWKNLKIINYPFREERWLHYQGRWGSPKSACVSIHEINFHICENNDGPTGIPQKNFNFYCPKTYLKKQNPI